MRRFLFTCLLTLALVPARATTELSCVGADFPFIYEQGKDGSRGLAVDLLKELGGQLDFRCRFEHYPWKRAQSLVVEGKADLLIGPYRTRERQAKMRFVGLPFYLDAMLVYVQRDKPQPAWRGDLQALRGYSVGVVRGWTLGQRYEYVRSQLQLDEADTLVQSFQKLLAGRIQAVMSNERNARIVLLQLGINGDVTALAPAIQQTGGYMALAPGRVDPALAEGLDRALQEAVRSGRVQALSQRYGLNFPGKRYDWRDYLQQELAE